VSAVAEGQAQHGIPWLQCGQIDGRVGIDARMGLDVDVLRTEQRPGPLDSRALDLIGRVTAG